MSQLSDFGQALLEAHRIALRTFKAHDFRVVDTRATLIRSEGQEGRLAAQEAKREYGDEKLQGLTTDEVATRTIRKMTFGKKKESLEPHTFQLKKVSKPGKPDQPQSNPQPPSPLPSPQLPNQQPANTESVVAADELSHEAAELATALSKEEMVLLVEMKPAAIGKEFGLARLRATADVLEIEYQESHSATALATAILNHIKKHRKNDSGKV